MRWRKNWQIYDLKHEKTPFKACRPTFWGEVSLLELVLGDDFPFQPLNIFMIQFMDPTVRGTILRTKIHNTTLLHHILPIFCWLKIYGPHLLLGGVYQAIENFQWFQTRIHELVKGTATSPTPMPLGHNFTRSQVSPTALAKRGMHKVIVTRNAAPKREGQLVTQPTLGGVPVGNSRPYILRDYKST